MSTSKNPKMQYLRKRGNAWYLNHPIPKELQACYPTNKGGHQTHIVRALGTSDPEEAYRRKVVLMPAILAEFSQHRRELKGMVRWEQSEARQLRHDIQQASNSDNFDLAQALGGLASDIAEDIYRKGGETPESLHKARTFVRITQGSETLKESFEEWLTKGNLPPRTQAKYRTALDEFVGFVGGEPLISDMNRESAIRYVDWLNREGKSQRTKKTVPLSFNSKRDRVMALSAFWNKWLFARQKTSVRVNPWAKLDITEKPTSSNIQWDSLENTGRPQRRPYFDDADLLSILSAPGPAQRATTRYTKRTLIEVLGLGLLTGARPDEVCSLTLADIRPIEGGYTLRFEDAKNPESDRRIPVVHPIAIEILSRRIGDRTEPAAQLFAEFQPKKGEEGLATLVLRALGRHLQRATGLTEGAVPYCTRHTFATVVGNNDDVKDVVLKRYVGHKPEGMTDAHYRSITMSSLQTLAEKVRYTKQIEQRMLEELGLANK